MHPMRFVAILLALLAFDVLPTCNGPSRSPTPTQPHLAQELVFYNWAEDMPQSVLDVFTREYGVQVTYDAFQSQEEALAVLRAGKVCDVVVIENQFIPTLVAEGRLAEIDYRNVPNFKNVAADFRDLVFDPGNRHTVPYHFGTTGLLVRTDLVDRPVTSWADLWDAEYAGRIALRPQMRELIGFTLLSLGYSFNSEDPEQLAAAEARLRALKPVIHLAEVESASAVPSLLNGEIVILVGWAEDVRLARQTSNAVTYVLPAEGLTIWGDSYVIPTNSRRKATAELFLDFLLRPQISAQIVNEKYYATANEAAYPLIRPELLNDPVIFPPREDIKAADFYLPLSPAGQKRYDEIWERFMTED